MSINVSRTTTDMARYELFSLLTQRIYPNHLCSLQNVQQQQMYSWYPFRLCWRAVCRHGYHCSDFCAWHQFFSYVCNSRLPSRSDLCWVRKSESVVYLITESRTSAATTAAHLSLLFMVLWRYFRGNWPEFLRSYIKNMVRVSVCTLIAVSGRRGVSSCSTYVHH